MSTSVLNFDHVNEALILLVLATNHLLDTYFFCFVEYFALAIFTWARQFKIRRLVNENLALFVSKEPLLRLKKPHNSTHLEPFTGNEFNQIKLFCKLSFRFLKKLVAFSVSASINKAFEKLTVNYFLVYAKVLYHSRH